MTRETKVIPRVLVFIVAYNAETTLSDVLRRIALPRHSCELEVLVIDDASRDRTFERGLEERLQHPYPITVLRNPVNQGYGGNQKIGYHYAIRNDFDAVVLLHGDGQYAPEVMGDILEPILTGEADAVFGSRMLVPKDARRGGMPLYKFLGNRILSSFQNRITGLGLSEYHSGYRAYSVEMLKKIPFEFNTNDFHFDTEIILQLASARARIREVPIPTYYGDEICHVNGIPYAWNVVKTTLAWRIHQMGIFSRIRYEVEDGRPRYDLKLGYPSSHTFALERIPDGSRVLEMVASEAAALAPLLKERSCTVFGVDVVPLKKGTGSFERFWCLDIDRDPLPEVVSSVDIILLLDVIEHLGDPEGFLLRLRRALGANSPRIIMTVPNVAFLPVRLMLLLGQFNYSRTGILDKTHRRLFTFSSFLRLLRETGYDVQRVRGVPAPFPKALGRNFLSRFLLAFNGIALSVLPGLFSYQIYAEAAAQPTLETLLESAQRHSAERAGDRAEKHVPGSRTQDEKRFSEEKKEKEL
ncbi:MAG: glycosyltransferase [Candidatus Hydrogenedentota bacterium]|nr:MAG: glycosyltransferase [Candidatus Hydrogenedentota bacterium]